MASSLDVRNITLEVISAADLKQSKKFGKQEAYAVGYVYPHDKKSTKVDKQGQLNPEWKSTLKFMVEDSLVEQGNGVITLEIRCRGTFGSKLLGLARIPVSSSPKENGAGQPMTLELSKPSRKSQGVARGTVNVSLAVGEKRTVQLYQPPTTYKQPGYGYSQQSNGYGDEPAYGYPARGYNGYPQQGYGYQQQGYGYQQQGYGYPQQGYGYGYQQRRRGGGGLGILAALLGGLLIGDVLF